MEIKKNPKSNLENYSKLFTQIGLVLALFVAYVAVEKKTFDRHFKDLASVSMSIDPEIEPPITKIPEPEVPEMKKPVIPDDPEVVDNEKEIEETIIDTTEIDETTEIKVEDIQEEEIIEETIEDVPFISIEQVPIFPGCKGSNDELKVCFNKKMQKHFAKKFDSDLPNELGLAPGRKRLIMLFKIDKEGNIIDIRTKAPHPKLQKEAVRLIKLLPKMKPGKQRGRAVGVKYTLPMRIDVE